MLWSSPLPLSSLTSSEIVSIETQPDEQLLLCMDLSHTSSDPAHIPASSEDILSTREAGLSSIPLQSREGGNWWEYTKNIICLNKIRSHVTWKESSF